jgi:hypothetical protein
MVEYFTVYSITSKFIPAVVAYKVNTEMFGHMFIKSEVILSDFLMDILYYEYSNTIPSHYYSYSGTRTKVLMVAQNDPIDAYNQNNIYSGVFLSNYIF